MKSSKEYNGIMICNVNRPFAKALIALLCSIAMCLTMGSCSENECTEIAIVNARVSFFDHENPNDQAMADTLSVVGLNDNGEPLDTLLYNKEKRVDHVLLPLRRDASETRYLFTYYFENDVQATDTLTIRHENKPYVISPECGCVVFHTLQSVETTLHQIRESKIVNSQITNKDEIHITLFY